MLINHSEKFAMLLASSIDTENNEPAEMKFLKENFGKFVHIHMYVAQIMLLQLCVNVIMRWCAFHQLYQCRKVQLETSCLVHQEMNKRLCKSRHSY